MLGADLADKLERMKEFSAGLCDAAAEKFRDEYDDNDYS